MMYRGSPVSSVRGLLIVLWFATACGGPSAGTGGSTGGEPIAIGWANVDTGSSPLPQATAGIKAGVDYVNKQGGINGRMLTLKTCSVGTDDPSNAACGQQFANDDSAKVVMLGVIQNGGPMYAALEPSGKPVLGLFPLTPVDFQTKVVTYYNIGNGVSDVITQYVRKQFPSARSVGIVHLDSAGGRQGADINARQLRDKYKVTQVGVSQSTPDATSNIVSLGTVDVYIVRANGNVCVQAAAAINRVAPGKPVVASQSCGAPAILKQASTNMQGWVIASSVKIATLATASEKDVGTYLSEYPKYGDSKYLGDDINSAEWGLTLTMAKILRGINKNDLTSANIKKGILSFTGNAEMGPVIKCPGKVYPTSCASSAMMFKVHNDGLDSLGQFDAQAS